MTTEQAKQLSESAISNLMESLEKGQSDSLKAYLAAMSRFHNYSWGNVLLIHSQRPDATNVAGFHGWLRLRRYVKKGEKGIVILAPMVGRKRSTSDDQLAEDQQTHVFGFRAAHVFDVAQTEGEPLPEFATVKGDPSEANTRLQEFVARNQIALEYDGKIAPARGLSSGGRITLLPDLAPAEHFAILVHEVAHELLHRGERRKDTTHTVRETEAEAVAFVVSSASDDFSARTASELCGKEEQLKLSYSLSENNQDARVSLLTGRATAHKATISTSKSYNLQRDWVFESKIFAELKNAQSIVLAYDGVNPLPPSYCYLKPYYLDPNKTYFEQLAAGEI